jgi:hypothetical protein
MISKTNLTFIKSTWEALVWLLLWVILWMYSLVGGHEVFLLDVLLVLVIAVIYGQCERRYFLAQLKLPKGEARSWKRELVVGGCCLLASVAWAYWRTAHRPDVSAFLYALLWIRAFYFAFSVPLRVPRRAK